MSFSLKNIVWLWARHLRHANMDLLNKLTSQELVVNLTKNEFEKEKVYDVCQKGKETKNSFKSRNHILSSRTLKLLHMDLFSPIRTCNLGKKTFP